MTMTMMTMTRSTLGALTPALALAGLLASPLAASLAAQGPGAPEVITLPAADRALELRVDDVYRLGGLDTDEPWQEFGWVRALAFGPDGRLFILDQRARQVHAVAPDGRYAGPVGSEGEGPGEYQLPTGLAVGPDGTIAVRDTRSNSFVLFDARGEYLRNARPDASRGSVGGSVLGPDSWLYGEPSLLLRSADGGSELVAGYLAGGDGVYGVTHLPLLRVHLERDEPEVIERLWIAPRTAEGRSSAQVAFLPEWHWAVFPDGAVAVADSTTWSVRVRAANVGGSDLELRRPIEPRRVTGADREAETARRAAEGPGAGGGGGMVAFGGTPEERDQALARARQRQLEQVLGFYHEIQVVQGLGVDHEGRLWVSRAPDRVGEPGPIDIVTRDGEYLGTVEGLTLPDAFGPDGLAAWLGRGELDVPEVVVRRLVLGG